ncbi:MAG: hypothetical protein H7Y88_08310 [Phycisphaerales bacterium]|nr:hypothetical protein [Phycisphaerales bacterium]
MPFSTDRSLLALEPNLFRDISWTGQQLLSAVGSISGTTLTLATGDAAAVGITAGHVALVGSVSLEITARLSATTLTVSRLRASVTDPVIPPPILINQPVVITTFTPQAAIVHDTIVRLLGLDSGLEGHPTAADITNPTPLALLEALGALQLIHVAASSLSPDSATAARAEHYRKRFAQQRTITAASIDLDSDGLPDAVRHLGFAQLFR